MRDVLDAALAHYFPGPDERARIEAKLLANDLPEKRRVLAAVLRLAAGDEAKLEATLASARRDYRDVLAWAEHDRSFAIDPSAPAEEKRRARLEDEASRRAWHGEIGFDPRSDDPNVVTPRAPRGRGAPR